MVALAGCSDGVLRDDLPDDLPGDQEAIGQNVYIRFQMDLNSEGYGGSRAASRADGDVPPATTPGKANENTVNTVDILIYDKKDDKLVDVVFLDKDQASQMCSKEGLIVPVFIEQGKTVRIFAAANMTTKMRRQFMLGQSGTDFSVSSTESSYRDVINEFVPGSDGKQATLEANGSCIPMSGQFLVESVSAGDTDNTVGSGDVKIDGHTTKDNPLTVKAKVGRIVAKVHVLAKTEQFEVSTGEKIEYVVAKKDDSNWIGWIRLDGVRYILNGTNKSTYIFPQPNAPGRSNSWKDFNMDLAKYRNGSMFIDYENDFMFYSGISLHRENISATSSFAQVDKFVELTFNNTKAGSDTEDRYTVGMYCLENYFDAPDENSADDKFYATRKDAIPMITHLYIAAKLTPRSIVIKGSYQKDMDDFVNKFEDNHEATLKEYGLTKSDFTDADVETWTDIKERYSNSKEGGNPFVDDEFIYRDNFRIIKTQSEADAAALIKWSLMVNELWSGDAADFENGKYPASTFYVYDTKYDDKQILGATWDQRYLYLTAGAVNAATGDNMKIKTYSVPHVGGWGYYYTYLDQLGMTADGKTPYKASQVTRNTYYLVTVNNFGYPGGTITRPEYIKANTTSVGWDYCGKGDINLH